MTDTHAQISLIGLSKGHHTLTVIAKGARTRYPLSRERMDIPLDTAIPVKVSVPIVLV